MAAVMMAGGLCILGLPAAPAFAAPPITGYYEIVDVTPPGTSLGNGNSVNPNGQVALAAGSCGGCADIKAYVYSGGQFINLMPALDCPTDCPQAQAQGINGNGLVAVSTFDGPHLYSFRYSLATGHATRIPGLEVQAAAINGSGQVVGQAQNPGGLGRAFIWDGKNTKLLGTFGGPTSQAFGTYASGQAVGCADTANGHFHPFLYKGGKLTDLGNPPGWLDGCATTVNKSGVIGGYSVGPPQPPIGNRNAIAWIKSNGHFTVLPLQPGFEDGEQVIHLSDAGESVGFMFGGGGSNLAGFRYKNGTVTNLNSVIPFDSGWDIQFAFGNNLKGQIVGQANSRPVLLNPIAIIDDANPLLRFSSGWIRQPGTGFNGSVHHSQNTNSTATFAFTGRTLSVIGPVGPAMGSATIMVDGVQTTFTQLAATSADQQRVFTKTFNQVGSHHVTIMPNGGGDTTIDAVTYATV